MRRGGAVGRRGDKSWRELSEDRIAGRDGRSGLSPSKYFVVSYRIWGMKDSLPLRIMLEWKKNTRKGEKHP